jgi:putative heme iron utilization protein
MGRPKELCKITMMLHPLASRGGGGRDEGPESLLTARPGAVSHSLDSKCLTPSIRSVKAAMASAPVDPNEANAAAVADVKRLMRLARTGALATLEATGGAPLTTLVGVASDFDGAPLFLMSTLSRHTRNLAADPRASLLLTGAHDRGDPLNHPRVTLSGRVERCTAPRAKARYLQRNPKATLYAGFADFAFYQLRIDAVHFNGGFGRAAPLTVAEVLASRDGEAALAEAEERLIAETNALGAPMLARLAGRQALRPAWRAIGLDSEGLDLAAGGRAARAQFAAPAHDPGQWRARLEQRLAAG